MTRALVLATTVAIAIGTLGVQPAGASAVVSASGGALGSGSILLASVPVFPQPVWTESGGYATSGQLGKGSYTFDGIVNLYSCLVSGTAKLVRSDGAFLTGRVAGRVACGGPAGPESLTADFDVGTRDLVGAHLVFSGEHGAGGAALEPGFIYSNNFRISGDLTVNSRIGYLEADARGHVSAFGGAPSLGNAPTASATRVALTPSRNGYWIVDASGKVFAFGDARWFGNAPALAFGETVRSLGPTATNRGYWLFTSNGRVLVFGDARFYGDMRRTHLRSPIVDAASTPAGRGYYLVGADGGIFAFGDARFYGSTGNLRLNQPVDGFATTASGHGYWLAARDGGIFNFGDAPFRGSMGGRPLRSPVVGIARYGTGYLLVASDGGIFDFSPQLFFGSGSGASSNPVVAVAATG